MKGNSHGLIWGTMLANDAGM